MVQAQKISTGKSDIWIDEEGILRLYPVEGEEIDLEEAKRCFQIYRQLGCCENKRPQLIITKGSSALTAEARNYAAKHGQDCFTASAVVSNSLAIRFLVNFFNSFYKSPIPFRMFKTEEEALEWLRGFRK